jgi:hypothetical protein
VRRGALCGVVRQYPSASAGSRLRRAETTGPEWDVKFHVLTAAVFDRRVAAATPARCRSILSLGLALVVELEGAGRLAGGLGHSLFLVGPARQLFKGSNPPFVSDRQVWMLDPIACFSRWIAKWRIVKCFTLKLWPVTFVRAPPEPDRACSPTQATTATGRPE